MNIAARAWYADGTNTQVYGGCKLQVTCVQSEYAASGSSAGCHDIWPDALPIVNSKGNGILDLVSKQLLLVGCTFLSCDNTTSSHGAAFRLVFGVTDAGGDISKTKKLISAVINARPFEHHIPIYCQHHQASLGERRQLKFTDTLSIRWKLKSSYSSTLVKWGYCLRNRRVAIRSEWKRQYGKASADSVCTRIVRVPCATRWGSTGDCEEDMDRESPDQYKSVFANVTHKDDKKKKKVIGVENKDKMGIMGGQEFLNPFNAISNRALGAVENVQSSKAANKILVDSTDPMNMYQPETRQDKGDFDIYGNFRPDEQGFIGSTNNPGMTMSKYGGPTYQKGAIVEMDANELQQFMEAGGQIEFL